ncbi:helix-turn-helix domain-containing protein [Paenibacillus athensensis]|uniref:AraC family transcriptional regulator n=1 Tax=Paenibacillus athensensis TaxID=1967502 RepID=A0A4Y8PT31_9BACL|nr:helix-turn-helix domain-containing protein [Paenibacillus athensensis]MCD1261317.1 helix-turn-helix domain-containing protein [Paenibacillus athensensis]
MYKAVLVDDENYDLEGLVRFVPWRELGIEVVHADYRPLQVLRYLEEHEVDLLISDIKMPMLSGIELAKKALEFHPELSIVFISGYEDFQYAKQALALKADGYILKPVDDKEIVDTLKRTVAELDEKRKKSAPPERLQPGAREFIRSNFVLQLLEGGLAGETLDKLLRDYAPELQGRARAAFIEVDDVAKSGASSGEQLQGVTEQLLSEITAYIEERRLGWTCRISHYQIGAALCEPPERDNEAELQQLLRHVTEATGHSVTIAAGEAAAGPEGLSGSYLQAKTLIGGKMFLGKNRLITAKSEKQPQPGASKDIDDILNDMFAAMASYSLVKIVDSLEELFQLVRRFEHRITVYNFSIHVMTKLDSYLRQLNETFQSLLGWDLKQWDIVHSFDTVDDIQRWLRRVLFEISEMLYLKKQNKNRKLFQEIEQYIDERLAEEITLREVANYFSYSPNHLGVLFKEQMGENFGEHVTRKRMELARQLLVNSKLKIYEISYQVGFKNMAYFSRQFKEYFGIPPGDYRKQS